MTEEQSPCSGPGCGAMFAIEVIGSELKLTVLHSLLSGPKRFNELRVATGICQSSLAKTLKEVEEGGIAERKVHLDRPVAGEYRLSPKGQGLFEGIRDLEVWATRWATAARGDARSRAGPPPAVTPPDKGLGSRAGNGPREPQPNPIDARRVAALTRLRRVSPSTRYDRTQRALAPGFAQLSSLSSRLGLA